MSVTLIISLFAACGNASDRPAAVAGQFYPENPAELMDTVDSCFSSTPKQNVQGKIKGFVAPHAGYVYSGQTAAYCFSLLKNSPVKTVVLIGNSHRYLLSKGAVFSRGSFKTPLGSVKIDETLAKKILSKTSLLEENEAAHGPEHSLEVELPFLQRALSDFRIVPILLSGNFSLQDCEKTAATIADSLKELGLDKEAVIIASSDMSHYPSWANANMADNKALKTAEKFDPKTLKETIDGLMSAGIPGEECVFCGAEAVYTTMYAAKNLGADTAKVLKYTNSGDTAAGDRSRVVGYGALAFVDSKEKQNIKEPAPGRESRMDDFRISEKNQKILLKTARESVAYYLKNRKLKEVSSSDPELKAPAAVFVTLTENKELRGCIGMTVARGPLINTVNEMAAAAAFEDTRFSPVAENELDKIHFEISILSPMRRVKDAGEIKQNIHGVVVRRGGRGGLFLPQVWEHFSTKEDFLSELCSQKAGLSRDAWKGPDTELYVFTVFAFEEPK